MEIVQLQALEKRMLKWVEAHNDDASRVILHIIQSYLGTLEVNPWEDDLFAKELQERKDEYKHCFEYGFYTQDYSSIIYLMYVLDHVITFGIYSAHGDSFVVQVVDNMPIAHYLFDYQYMFPHNYVRFKIKED